MNLLRDLVDYCEKEGLLSPFHVVSVNGKLVLGEGVPRVEFFDKPRRIQVPVVKRSGAVIRPYDGYDNEEYVLGDGEAFKAFWERQEKFVCAAGEDAILAAIAEARVDISWIRSARAAASKALAAKTTVQHVMIALAFEDGLVIERPAVREHFVRDLRRSMDAPGPDRCLVTGRPCTAVALHANIQGVPGSGAGFPLVSFNQKTSTQHGLEQGANFPTSLYAVRSYASALNHLLATQKFKIGENACGVLWGTPVAASMTRVLSDYCEPDTLAAAWAEIASAPVGSETKLHALFLKGSQGREAVLGYSILDVGTALGALVQFRDHFQKTYRAEDGSIVRVLPTFLGRLRAVSPLQAAKNKDAGQILDWLTKMRTVESLLSGSGLPEDAMRRIVATLSSFDVADSESVLSARKARHAAAKIQLRWYEYQRIVQGKQTPVRYDAMTDVIREEPTLRDFGLSEERPDPGATDFDSFDLITIGRLISLEESITREAHGRNIQNSSLPMIGINLAVWYQDHFRRMRVAIDKLARGGRPGTYYTKQAEAAAAQISGAERVGRAVPLRPDERAPIFLGYTKQDAFARARGRWLAQERRKKQASTRGENGRDDEAAE